MATPKKTTRLKRIEELLADRGVLRLRDAAQQLQVSEMTVRRTLAAHPQLFAYLGGYILSASGVAGNARYSLQLEAGSHAEAKSRACAHALTLVRQDDTIFIDCGTTLEHLAKQIPGTLSLTVICYSLNVANHLANKPNIRLILLGGVFHASSASFAGIDNGGGRSTSDLSCFGIHKAFISAGGVDPQRGLSCSSTHEVAIKQQAMAVALESHLVVDESKFNRLRPAMFAKLGALTSIITERGIKPIKA